MLIIGITGTLGAGKGAVVNYLVSKYNFAHFSSREFITKEITKRGLPINRDTMTTVANELRQAHSPGYIAEQLFKQAQSSGKNSIIESLRNVGEIETLKHQASQFVLLAVEAGVNTRFKRISGRNNETDQVNFETFVMNEQREMNSTDPNQQNLQACAKLADFRINNNGTLEDLHKQIDAIIQKLQLI